MSGEPTDIKGFPASERAGCVLLRKTRAGIVVGVYNTAEAGLDSTEGAWACVCETHGGIVNFNTKTGAKSWVSHPEDWCPDCQEIKNKERPGLADLVFKMTKKGRKL